MRTRLFVAVFLAVVCTQYAIAQVVTFTSFQAGSAFDQVSQGVYIGAFGQTNQLGAGFQFTAGVSGSLHSVRVPTKNNLGSPEVLLSLLTDNGGEIGTVMKSWQFPGSANWNIDTVTNSDPLIVLDAGTKYWLVMGEVGQDESFFWGRSLNGGLMQWVFTDDGGQTLHYGNTDIFCAYEVNVNPVPEPTCVAALGLGALALVRRRRTLRSAA